MNLTRLSKICSQALRHSPESFDLKLDENGWVKVDKFLNAINKHCKKNNIILSDLHSLVNNPTSKKRHEIKNDKIRAIYGHSFYKKIKYKAAKNTPEYLFHGTSQVNWKSIKEEGLRSMSRSYVHLTSDLRTAIDTAKRKDSSFVILKINTFSALKEGVVFYLGEGNIWLCDDLSPKFIHLFDEDNL